MWALLLWASAVWAANAPAPAPAPPPGKGPTPTVQVIDFGSFRGQPPPETVKGQPARVLVSAPRFTVSVLYGRKTEKRAPTIRLGRQKLTLRLDDGQIAFRDSKQMGKRGDVRYFKPGYLQLSRRFIGPQSFLVFTTVRGKADVHVPLNRIKGAPKPKPFSANVFRSAAQADKAKSSSMIPLTTVGPFRSSVSVMSKEPRKLKGPSKRHVLWVLLEGQALLITKDGSRTIGPDTLVWIPARAPGTVTLRPLGRVISLVVTAD